MAIPWIIIAHGPRPKNDKLGPQQNLDLNTSSERSLSKLSENQDIGSTILKLWLLKDQPYWVVVLVTLDAHILGLSLYILEVLFVTDAAPQEVTKAS